MRASTGVSGQPWSVDSWGLVMTSSAPLSARVTHNALATETVFHRERRRRRRRWRYWYWCWGGGCWMRVQRVFNFDEVGHEIIRVVARGRDRLVMVRDSLSLFQLSSCRSMPVDYFLHSLNALPCSRPHSYESRALRIIDFGNIHEYYNYRWVCSLYKNIMFFRVMHFSEHHDPEKCTKSSSRNWTVINQLISLYIVSIILASRI